MIKFIKEIYYSIKLRKLAKKYLAEWDKYNIAINKGGYNKETLTRILDKQQASLDEYEQQQNKINKLIE